MLSFYLFDKESTSGQQLTSRRIFLTFELFYLQRCSITSIAAFAVVAYSQYINIWRYSDVLGIHIRISNWFCSDSAFRNRIQTKDILARILHFLFHNISRRMGGRFVAQAGRPGMVRCILDTFHSGRLVVRAAFAGAVATEVSPRPAPRGKRRNGSRKNRRIAARNFFLDFHHCDDYCDYCRILDKTYGIIDHKSTRLKQ